ncbi:NAD-dependent succinate-semialdehyde dehydrogenase [Ramlibacter sp.]|uniref:NAD-dependent succinate-semialdehyde dehydrogenase n=1 Tax=Ramlibacter sp. TaxID=1917967 RepID=UPI0039C982EC
MYRHYGLFIDGAWRPAAGGAVREVLDPASEDILGWIPVAAAADLDAALASAQAGFELWRRTSPWDRAAVLRKAADLIRSREQEIGRLMSQETGKPLAQACGETRDAADQFEWYAGETQRIYGQTIESRLPQVRMQIRHEPVGVVAAFSAWNFPALLPSRKIGAALGAGCSIIVKPASEAAGSCMAVVQALADAGCPAGVVNVVTGDSRFISEYLVRSPAVAKISLTGSSAVGRQLLQLAADGIKRVSMELGGHAPVLVFEDADVAYAAEQCARFKYRNAGQVCASPSRFYVHERIYPAFCDRFAQVARSLKVGSGLDPATEVGPLANRRGLEHTQRLVADALERGSRLLAGGARPAHLPGTKGYFFAPTALADVPQDALIMRQEPFGPVAPIAPFATFDEAIALANSTEYGLASYLFSQSLTTATLASEAIKAGMVGINELAIASAEMPFGGVGASGMGREGGPLGIRDYLEAKFVKTRLL